MDPPQVPSSTKGMDVAITHMDMAFRGTDVEFKRQGTALREMVVATRDVI